MTDRLKAMRRVLGVQDQLKRAADARLAEAERAAAALDAARAEVAGFLSGDGLAGPLAGLAAAQARRLAGQAASAAAAVTAETEAMREAARRQKLLARAVDALARDEAAARERKDLERLIEGFAARDGTPGG